MCYAEPNNSHIVFSGSDDSYIKVWDRRSMDSSNPRPAGVLVGHTEGIVRVLGMFFIQKKILTGECFLSLSVI